MVLESKLIEEVALARDVSQHCLNSETILLQVKGQLGEVVLEGLHLSVSLLIVLQVGCQEAKVVLLHVSLTGELHLDLLFLLSYQGSHFDLVIVSCSHDILVSQNGKVWRQTTVNV